MTYMQNKEKNTTLKIFIAQKKALAMLLGWILCIATLVAAPTVGKLVIGWLGFALGAIMVLITTNIVAARIRRDDGCEKTNSEDIAVEGMCLLVTAMICLLNLALITGIQTLG